MVRVFAIACVLSCLAASASGQTQSAPGTAAIPTTTPAKPAAKKPTPKATTSAKPPASVDAGPCQIGVIPVNTNKFGVQKVGLTILGNEYAQVPVDGWGLDDVVVTRVRAAAAVSAVRKIAYTKEDLQRAKSDSFFHNVNAEWRDFVRQVAAGANCQRYVLLTISSSQFANTNQTVEGFGILFWGNLIKKRTYLFALTHVRIFDGQNFELIREAKSAGDDVSLGAMLIGDNPIRGPVREVDETSFPATPADASTNPALREGARALLAASLDKTLPAMLRQ
jgi:hypothetical protein